MKPILEKLKQESTWRGIIVLIGIAGVEIAPELANEIIAVGMGIVGIINIAKND
jgi:hypothetical protein